MKDLFEHYEELPTNVLNLIGDDWDATYENCIELENKLEPLGYTFEWGLDAMPYNLRKI